MKVIELDQRTGEKVSMGEFPDDQDGASQAEARVKELEQTARGNGDDHLRYWVEY